MSISRKLSFLAIVLCPFMANQSSADPPGARPYTLFESGHVRPLAISPDGTKLFAVNTPDNQLEVFRIKLAGLGLEHLCSVPVGLEPVAVAARSDDEVWVVNHLSDSISIVNVNLPRHGFVERTLLVGDEPRDIVFAGPGKNRAFITTAHRGQNVPYDPQLTTPGVGRADVWVFNADQLGASLGGTPLTIVQLFTDTPRALATSPDGSLVYAAGHFTGNRTATIGKEMTPLTEAEGGPPEPNSNYEGIPRDRVGQIVRFDGQHWVDKLGRSFNDFVNFSLPDKDVFVIDANASPPAQLAGSAGFYAGVGTTIFNMVVNPVNNKIYVSNTEALNHIRFEGDGSASGGETLKGRFAESRITVLSNGNVTPRHLNKHIDYSQCCAPTPNAESEKSLAIPLEMVVSSNGQKLYVAALGSSKVGVFNTSALENNTFVPSPANHINLTGGGPTGLVLDEARNRLYVMTRFDNSISIINTNTKNEINHISLHNPEPASVVNGRRFLYDAKLTSSRGDSSCAVCHVFGDLDHLAWDLGNPQEDVVIPPGPFRNFPFIPGVINFHPLKGPMTTQSLRGLDNHGPLHWRGDRNGGLDGPPNAQPDSGSFDENAAFLQFNTTFINLHGRDAELSVADMQAFADFTMQLTYPPNPIRALDNSLTATQAAGRDIFFNAPVVQGSTCESCHRLDPLANAEFGVASPGFFGTDGFTNGVDLDQAFKTPHFRNMYQKVGRFGMIPWFLINEELDGSFQGDQIRGFGFFNDGSHDTIARFLQGFVAFPEGHPLSFLNPTGFPQNEEGREQRRWVEDFILAFDSNLAPIVGQQITLTASNAATAGPRIDLMIARANAQECDLVVKGLRQARMEGYLYSGGVFLRDQAGEPTLSDAQLRNLAKFPRRQLTYTCVPPGGGVRIALDRDLDGALDGDEFENGSDPTDPNDLP